MGSRSMNNEEENSWNEKKASILSDLEVFVEKGWLEQHYGDNGSKNSTNSSSSSDAENTNDNRWFKFSDFGYCEVCQALLSRGGDDRDENTSGGGGMNNNNNTNDTTRQDGAGVDEGFYHYRMARFLEKKEQKQQQQLLEILSSPITSSTSDDNSGGNNDSGGAKFGIECYQYVFPDDSDNAADNGHHIMLGSPFEHSCQLFQVILKK